MRNIIRKSSNSNSCTVSASNMARKVKDLVFTSTCSHLKQQTLSQWLFTRDIEGQDWLAADPEQFHCTTEWLALNQNLEFLVSFDHHGILL